MFAPKAAPPALLGSLGLLMFVYGIGIQYGKQFFSGVTSPFGLKANGLALLSHLAAIGVCYLGYAAFAVTPAGVAGLFCGALTSTPALQAAISAAGNNDPALGYSVAYPFGVIAPILCMYFANLWSTCKALAPAGAGLELREVAVRNPRVVGRPLAEVSAELPTGVRIVVVREGNQNRVPAPDLVLAHNGRSGPGGRVRGGARERTVAHRGNHGGPDQRGPRGPGLFPAFRLPTGGGRHFAGRPADPGSAGVLGHARAPGRCRPAAAA